jgi:hypothetical protein
MSKHQHTPASAAVGIEHAIRMLEGRWKLVILFHLFGGRKLRFSDLERAIPAISQKMLIQQLRRLEHAWRHIASCESRFDEDLNELCVALKSRFGENSRFLSSAASS